MVSQGWKKDEVTELISYLDTVLEWDDDFFKQFTQEYINILKEEHEVDGNSENAPEEMLEQLAALYKANLSIMNWKLAMADMKLNVAESSLLKVTNQLNQVTNALVTKSDGELHMIRRYQKNNGSEEPEEPSNSSEDSKDSSDANADAEECEEEAMTQSDIDLARLIRHLPNFSSTESLLPHLMAGMTHASSSNGLSKQSSRFSLDEIEQ
jgi:hypothetical protein